MDIDFKQDLFARDGYRCRVCFKSIFGTHPQIAHRIPQTKNNIKKFGKEVIHHPLNLYSVCSLKCNNECQLNPATHPIEALELVKEIQEAIEKTRP